MKCRKVPMSLRRLKEIFLMRNYCSILLLAALFGSHSAIAENTPVPSSYFDQSGREDTFTGGVRMITVQTANGPFRVWTKRVGANPRIKVLLLHGGPGVTHEYFEALDSYLPGAGIEYYYYDQLGSAYSDQPDMPGLWELPRFVEEVEQVRKALKLEKIISSCSATLGVEFWHLSTRLNTNRTLRD